ncbi:MAG TPA: hypothetical protein VFF73_31970, partial [Planctomycetota bacterium]|nr:hypothetical protein [Planctomycetota bacterium]
NGAFKSTDGGSTWSQMQLSQFGGGGNNVAAIVKDPSTTGSTAVLYATNGNQVVKTTDAGALWNPAGQGVNAQQLNALGISPNAHLTVYAGTNAGVFVTTTGGN